MMEGIKMNKEVNNIIMLFFVLSLAFIGPIELGFAAESTNNVATRAEIGNSCNIVPPVNVKDSLVLSVVMMCIPGVLEKAQEYRNIKCEAVVCKYEAVKNSLDPAFCEKEASFDTCKYIVGEVFAIPPMSILEHFRKLIADALANPIGLAYSALSIAARKHITTCTNSWICGAEAILLSINELSSIYQTFADMSENGFFSDSGEDYCSKIDGIVSELEEIVNS